MLHLIPQPQPADSPEPYAEAVARLASIRHALRLVDLHAGGPADDGDDAALGRAWAAAPAARRRSFDSRCGRVIAATADGLEALLAERALGREPNAAATARLADEIRRGLDDVSELMLAR